MSIMVLKGLSTFLNLLHLYLELLNWIALLYYRLFSFNSNSSEILLLRGHSGNKVYNLLFLCNPYDQLSAIKDIVSYSLVFYC